MNILSKYIEYTIEYSFKSSKKFSKYFSIILEIFFNTDLFIILILEILLIVIFPYPGLNSALIYIEMGYYICYPISSIFTAITILRFYFILKLFKQFQNQIKIV